MCTHCPTMVPFRVRAFSTCCSLGPQIPPMIFTLPTRPAPWPHRTHCCCVIGRAIAFLRTENHLKGCACSSPPRMQASVLAFCLRRRLRHYRLGASRFAVALSRRSSAVVKARGCQVPRCVSCIAGRRCLPLLWSNWNCPAVRAAPRGRQILLCITLCSPNC